MTYYDRIQYAINYIETHLEEQIDIKLVSTKAFMSVATLYRLFFALTGYSVKEYIRLRRLSLALKELSKGNLTILSIAINYGFESHASFSRTCKRLTGYPPSAFKCNNKTFSFERMNMMTKYTDQMDKDLENKYPDIKLLKELQPFKVAYFHFIGKEPENHAFEKMKTFFKESNLSKDELNFRVFGFNNPSPESPEEKEYGYEVWVTIDENSKIDESKTPRKIVDGGLYAVCGVKDLDTSGDGSEIYEAWVKLNAWLKDSRYELGNHQWMEEHLNFNDDFEHTGGMDLYMPIKKKTH